SQFPLRDYIPNANGYAFSYQEYDASVRLRYENMPGNQSRVDNALASDRFTLHEDEQQKKGELDYVLGNHAGSATDYTLHAVTDPNGQTTLTYLDGNGKTAYTALTTPPPNLLPIDTKGEPVYLYEDLMENKEENQPVPQQGPDA